MWHETLHVQNISDGHCFKVWKCFLGQCNLDIKNPAYAYSPFSVTYLLVIFV